MKKEKIVSLNKYLVELKTRLNGPVSEKHVSRPEQYKDFLKREIFKVNKSLDEARLEDKK